MRVNKVFVGSNVLDPFVGSHIARLLVAVGLLKLLLQIRGDLFLAVVSVDSEGLSNMHVRNLKTI